MDGPSLFVVFRFFKERTLFISPLMTLSALQACAANTDACFLKLAGPQLVQMFIGDGAKIVRDAFELANEKAPTIIFIDELDAIGMKRSGGGELSGVREVQRTMLELLNQLDGFSGNGDVGEDCGPHLDTGGGS